MTPLPTLGGNNGFAAGVNSRGQVAGQAEIASPDPTCDPLITPQVLQAKPVIWRNGSIRELPTFAGDPDGQAEAINDIGQAVGSSGSCINARQHALLWQNGRAINLGTLGGTMNNVAFDINNQGQERSAMPSSVRPSADCPEHCRNEHHRAKVVSSSGLPGDTTFHAFLWQNGVMRDLGTLSGDVMASWIHIHNAPMVNQISWVVVLPLDSEAFILSCVYVKSRGAPLFT